MGRMTLDDQLPRWRRLRRRFWFRVAQGVLAGLSVLPEAGGRWLCQALARLGPVLRPGDRCRARDNLKRVYPDWSEAQVEAMMKQSIHALGDNLHMALTAERQASRGFPSVVEEPGPDGRGLRAVLDELGATGQGVLLVTAHLGCWELLGAWLAGHLDRPAVITGTIRNPAVDRLLQDRRRALGVEPLSREAGARPILRALDRGAVVGVLLDQNTRVASAPLPFLGRMAPTPLGPARIAIHRGTPLVPAAMVREQGSWVARYREPIRPRPGEDALSLTARCNEALSELVLRNPAQWVWFHDRWNDAAN